MLTNEKALISQMKDGKEKAFEQIFLFYSPKIYNFCRRFHLNSSDAEEIVQIVFSSIWEKRSSIDVNKSFSAYLFTSARNWIVNTYKKKVYKKAYIDYYLFHESEFSFVTEEKVLYDELSALIEAAIDELPPRCKEIFLLSRGNELSYREIARQLSITESTVNTQITKALDFLRKKILE